MLSSLYWEKDSWPINFMKAEKPRNLRVLKSWHKVGPRSVYVMLGRNMKSRYIRHNGCASFLPFIFHDFINCIRSPTMIGLMLLDVARCGWGKWRAEPHHSLNTWRPGFKVKFLSSRSFNTGVWGKGEHGRTSYLAFDPRSIPFWMPTSWSRPISGWFYVPCIVLNFNLALFVDKKIEWATWSPDRSPKRVARMLFQRICMWTSLMPPSWRARSQRTCRF